VIGPYVAELDGCAACAWCGQMVKLAAFTAHTARCEAERRKGQPGLFGAVAGQQPLGL
jgi:hypothetical protein